MGPKQTRKAVSLNAAIYEAAKIAAKAEGISQAEWITRLIRTVIPDLINDAQLKLNPILAEYKPLLKKQPLSIRKQTPSTQDSDGAKSSPNSFCAICINKPGFIRRPLGRDNGLVDVCVDCDTKAVTVTNLNTIRVISDPDI